MHGSTDRRTRPPPPPRRLVVTSVVGFGAARPVVARLVVVGGYLVFDDGARHERGHPGRRHRVRPERPRDRLIASLDPALALAPELVVEPLHRWHHHIGQRKGLDDRGLGKEGGHLTGERLHAGRAEATDDEAIAGARHGHIREAHALGLEQLALVRPRVAVARCLEAVAVLRSGLRLDPTVGPEDGRAGGPRLRVEAHQHDDRELEALRGVHGEDPHRVIVGIGLDRVVLPDVAVGLFARP